MSSRARALTLAVALGLLATPGFVGADIGTGDGAATPGSAVPGGAAAGLEQRLGAQVPLAARFRASDGREVALGDVLEGGKPALLVLAYNRCTMLCSLVLRRVAELVPTLKGRPGDQYSLLTISIDPSDTEHEASRLQAALLDKAGVPGEPHRWEFLVGERLEIDRVASALGFRYSWDPATQQYNHPAVLFTLSPDGRVSGYFDGLSPDPAAVEAALRLPGATPAAGILRDVILQCFRFDTAQSRYGSAITWLLRAGAASVALALGAAIWRLSRTQRRPEAQP
jgi:protein SCO1